MLELIILVVVVGAVVYRIDALNDVIITKAKARGEEPRLLSYTNPFHWIKAIAGGASYGIGYAPTAIKRTAQEAKRLHLEARNEIKLGQIEVETNNKTMKKAGALASSMHHSPRLVELQSEIASLTEALAK